MAGTAADRGTEHARVRAKESNSYAQGRGGGKVGTKLGPAYRRGVLPTNSTKSGGINRATKGMG